VSKATGLPASNFSRRNLKSAQILNCQPITSKLFRIKFILDELRPILEVAPIYDSRPVARDKAPSKLSELIVRGSLDNNKTIRRVTLETNARLPTINAASSQLRNAGKSI
jgi:hypothetical protein